MRRKGSNSCNTGKLWSRPGKAQAAASIFIGIIFIILGLTKLIALTGAVGIVITVAAAIIVAINCVFLFGKRDRAKEIAELKEETLSDLKSAYKKGLISPEVYEEKRKEISKWS